VEGLVANELIALLAAAALLAVAEMRSAQRTTEAGRT
jgi:hypothetical protein